MTHTPGQLANELPNLFSFARSAAGLEYWAEVCRRLEAEQRLQDAGQPVIVSSVTVTLHPDALYQNRYGTVNLAVGTIVEVMLTGVEAAKLGHALITKGAVLQDTATDEQPVYVDAQPHRVDLVPDLPTYEWWAHAKHGKIAHGSPVSERRVPRLDALTDA